MTKDVGKSLAEQALESRSYLYRWLYENRATIGPFLKKSRGWQVVASTADKKGIRTSAGGVPSRQAVRKVWMQMEQETGPVTRLKPTKTKASDVAASSIVQIIAKPTPVPEINVSQTHADSNIAPIPIVEYLQLKVERLNNTMLPVVVSPQPVLDDAKTSSQDATQLPRRSGPLDRVFQAMRAQVGLVKLGE